VEIAALLISTLHLGLQEHIALHQLPCLFIRQTSSHYYFIDDTKRPEFRFQQNHERSDSSWWGIYFLVLESSCHRLTRNFLRSL